MAIREEYSEAQNENDAPNAEKDNPHSPERDHKPSHKQAMETSC